ncbi:MAG: chorismate mutase [Alphaproteobacteria bacterium]
MEPAGSSLTDIRKRIDKIDETMHRLLMERSAEIEALVRAKNTAQTGAAFRPGREAAIMRVLALHHQNRCPFLLVEHMWRDIIATFTAMQASYRVVTSAGDTPLEQAAIRDLARFYFGFSVPVDACARAGDAIEACRTGHEGEAACLAVIALTSPGAWWAELGGEEAPAVVSRLPFVDSDGHPVRLPAYVLALPIASEEHYDTLVVRIDADVLPGSLLRAVGAVSVCQDGARHLIELPATNGLQMLTDAAHRANVAIGSITQVGGFHAPIHMRAGGNNEGGATQ